MDIRPIYVCGGGWKKENERSHGVPEFFSEIEELTFLKLTFLKSKELIPKSSKKA